MIYQHAKEASSEILRMAISSMAQHDAAYHPISYAVWYEYLGGINPGLQEEINALLAQGTKLTNPQVEALYERHIRKRDMELEYQTEQTLRHLVSDIGRITNEASNNAGQFQNALTDRSNQLNESMDPGTLRAVVQTLLSETMNLRESMSRLEAELQERNRQVETLRESMHAAQDQAMTDPLTGLLNRRGFAQVLAGLNLEEPAAGSKPVMLILVDIDHFKSINDTYGHVMGDKVIRSVAKLLTANVKGRDPVARFGGEEFAILLDNTPLTGAKNLAEQLRQTVANAKFRRTDNQADIGKVTISLGVAAYAPPETMEAFTHRADMALYASKKGGRNKVSIAAEADSQRAVG